MAHNSSDMLLGVMTKGKCSVIRANSKRERGISPPGGDMARSASANAQRLRGFEFAIKIGAAVLALGAALALSGCASAAHQDSLAGKGFVYEKGGFPDRFGIQLYDDGGFTYYVGAFSSHVGYGVWELDGDTLILLEDTNANGISNIFRFKVGEDSLSYIAEESDKFKYVDVGDGEKFTEEELSGFPF